MSWMPTHLEHEPLPNLCAFFKRLSSEFAFGIETFGNIQQNRARFPDNEVVVGMIDKGRDTTVALRSKLVTNITGKDIL